MTDYVYVVDSTDEGPECVFRSKEGAITWLTGTRYSVLSYYINTLGGGTFDGVFIVEMEIEYYGSITTIDRSVYRLKLED